MSKEYTNWADPDTLESVEQVKSADGKKMVSVTLTQARKHGLLPRTTSIISELTSYQIVEYQKEQCIRAAVAYPPDHPLDEEEAMVSYLKLIKAKADEFKNFTATRGKEIHGAVSKWLEGGGDSEDPVIQAIIRRLTEWLRSIGATEVKTEVSLGGRKFGFAGTPDMVIETPAGRILADLKTTSFKSFKKPYESWMLQLGGYHILTESEPGTKLVQVVADREYGDVRILDYDEPERWRDAFRHLFEMWTLLKGYDPRKV
jgi:hypothetical protein